MKKEQSEKPEFISLNTEFNDFSLQQLEERLETDPLAVGGLLDLNSSLSADDTDGCTYCIGCNLKEQP